MVSSEKARTLALAFEDATEEPHFEKTSFRVKKKIFATLDEGKSQVVLKLSEVDQSVFAAYDDSIIYPVPGGWGKKGWTVVELKMVREDVFLDALTTSYCNVASQQLADNYKRQRGDPNK